MNGKAPSWLGPAYETLPIFPGQAYAMSIIRGGREFSFSLRMGRNPSIHILDPCSNLFIAALFLASGIWMRISAPRDLTARLGTLTFLGCCLFMLSPVATAFPGWNSSTAWIAMLVGRLPWPLAPAVGWDFLSRFPHEVPQGKFVAILRRALYTTAIALWIVVIVPVFGQLFWLPSSSWLTFVQFLGWEGPLGDIPRITFDGIVAIACCYVLIRNYRLLTDVNSRRKMRLAVASFGFTSICLLILRTLDLAASVIDSAPLHFAERISETTMTVAMGILPLTLTYAVVKHHVLGVRLVIRRGLQYLLAKNVLRLIIFAPVLIVVAKIIRRPDQSVSDLIFKSSWSFYLLFICTAAFSLRYRRQLSKWLDKRFFRVALEEEEGLVRLSEDLKGAATEEEIAAMVAERIQAALPVQGIHIFLRSQSDGRLHAAFNTPGRNAQKLSAQIESGPPAVLTGNSVVTVSDVDSDFADPVRGDEQLLIVPFVGSDGRNVGALVLGPKRSEQDYTLKERELLQAVAVQMALACEVLRLKRSVDQESRQRIAVLGRLDRENIQLLNECFKCGRCYDSSMQQCPEDASALELTLPVERVVVGRYRLDRRLGAGGMGVVFAALDLRLQKLVAVKVMVGELFGNPRAALRFKREAQAIASLNHPNVVGVHDFGELPAGGAFLVMDLLRGVSWREMLLEPGQLEPDRVAGWVSDLCAGVAAAHAQNVIHRDLKPENVFICGDRERETAIVLDFGVAKVQTDTDPKRPKVSVTGAIIGTQSYMSPEQRAGQAVGPASDVFSIAVMVLETLAQSRPPATAAHEWVESALEKLAGSGALRNILRWALAEDSNERIGDARALGDRLSAAIRLDQPTITTGAGSPDTETFTFGAAN